MSQRSDDTDKPSEESTSSGESLDVVLSSIRDAVTTHAKNGTEGSRASPLALAFDDLRREVKRLRDNLGEKKAAPVLSQKEIEELVMQVARPMLSAMLKTWLDTNLPPLAERLIREEIERLSRER